MDCKTSLKHVELFMFLISFSINWFAEKVVFAHLYTDSYIRDNAIVKNKKTAVIPMVKLFIIYILVSRQNDFLFWLIGLSFSLQNVKKKFHTTIYHSPRWHL